MILSIGMAVDANVLIFERMKEELGHGKALLNRLMKASDVLGIPFVIQTSLLF